MKQIIYALQFKGQAVPTNKPGVLKTQMTAQSCVIATIIAAAGVNGATQHATGGNAVLESEVRVLEQTSAGETIFQESGTIAFGERGHRLRFSTVGQGRSGPSADPKLRHGTVTWRVEGGHGQFAGASGLITSNFLISDTGEVTDNHIGVIFVK